MPPASRLPIELQGKRWVVRTRKDLKENKGAVGLCEHPKSGKTIWIDADLDGRDLMETLIHEATHASLWMASEEWVSSFACDLARLLWKWGYRA